MEKLPPHIRKTPKGMHTKGNGNVRADYIDLLNDMPISKSGLKEYVASLVPMVYWTTWAKYKQAKNGG